MGLFSRNLGKANRSRKLRMESLEERTLLAVTAGLVQPEIAAAETAQTTWVVNTADDPTEWDTADTVLSLREAIARAEEGDTIVFDPSLANQTISLNGSQLELSKGITIDASEIGGVTINAQSKSRIFSITANNAELPAKLIGLTLTGGYCEGYGGAVNFSNAAVAEITNCSVIGNSVENSGGAFYSTGKSQVVVTGCTVRDNSASVGGAFYNDNYSTVTVINSAFTANTCDYHGGAFYNNSGTLNLTNVLIAQCSGDFGGGIYVYGGTVNISNCTITKCVAWYVGGGGIFNYSGNINVYNSIIAMNSSDIDCTGDACRFPPKLYNSISSFNSTYDASKPLFRDEAGGDYRLAEGSQAINAGNNEYATTETDLAGNTRIIYETVDIGAYEYCGEVEGWTGMYDGKPHSVSVTKPAGWNAVFSTDGKTFRSQNPQFIESGSYKVWVKFTKGESEYTVSESVNIGKTFVVTTFDDTVDSEDGVLSLREAVESAGNYDLITFDSSLKDGTITLNGSPIEIRTGISIDASSVGGIVISGNAKSRIFTITDTREEAVNLTGLHIVNGYAWSGAGIYVTSSKLNLTDCDVSYNSIIDRRDDCDKYCYGGGIYALKSVLVIKNSSISDNQIFTDGGMWDYYRGYFDGYLYGGGIYTKACSLTMASCTVIGNNIETKSSRTGCDGGGIYAGSGSLLTITDTAINGNSAYANSDTNCGGGIYTHKATYTILTDCSIEFNCLNREALAYGAGAYFYSPAILTGCIISNNAFIAGTRETRGGGVYGSTSLTLTNCIITNNSAFFGGGVFCSTFSSFTNCTISGNSGVQGGGICVSGDASFTNCNITENTASNTGGGIQTGYNTSLTNCTVAKNSAGTGGGIYKSSYSSDLTIRNSVVAENSADSGSDISTVSSYRCYAYNTLSSFDFADWTGAKTCYLYDPALPLFTDLESGDYTLIDHSQAIDKGNNDYIQSQPTDLAGNPRIINNIVDLGAYENQTQPVITDVTITGWNGYEDGNSHSITVTDPSAESDTILYSIDGITYNLTVNPAYTNPGTYTTYVKVSRAGHADWFGSADVVIIKKEKITDVSVTGWSGIEDGEPHSVTVTDPHAATDTITYTYNGKTSSQNPAFTEPGTYTVTVTVDRKGCYTWTGSAAVTIEKFQAAVDTKITVNRSIPTVTESANPESDSSVSTNTDFYVSVWVKSGDPNYGVEGGYCSLYFSEGAAPGTYTASPLYNDSIAVKMDDGHITGFGGFPQTMGAAYGAETWVLAGTYSFTASKIGTLTFYNDVATKNGAEKPAWNFNLPNGENTNSYDSVTVEVSNPLAAPAITTGSRNVFVSYGANRHLLQWNAVKNAGSYELAYSQDGKSWKSIKTAGTEAVVTGLTYGAEMRYRVRALALGTDYADSNWSEIKSFIVCPMDVNNDGDIANADRSMVGQAWLAEEGDENYTYYADINADGDVSNADRSFLAKNWLNTVGEDEMAYPQPLKADYVFEGFGFDTGIFDDL